MKMKDNIVTRTIKNRDYFGQPVGLNMDGSTTYQTIPGGLLSMFLAFVVMCYAVLVWESASSGQDWTLIQQHVVQSTEQLATPFPLEGQSNISIAL